MRDDKDQRAAGAASVAKPRSINGAPVFFPKKEQWRCSCGSYVLAGEGHICQFIRQADFYERLVMATERIAAALSRGPVEDAPKAPEKIP